MARDEAKLPEGNARGGGIVAARQEPTPLEVDLPAVRRPLLQFRGEYSGDGGGYGRARKSQTFLHRVPSRRRSDE